MTMSTRNTLGFSVFLAGLLSGLPAWATNGYFSNGYGVQSQGLGGTGIALPLDGLAAATNPAGIALIGNRFDVGATLFQPDRGADITGNFAGPGVSLNGHYDGNDTRRFLIPEFGYVRQLGPQWAAALAVYGNGGMNTDYGHNPWAAFGAQGSAGVNLEQLFVSPALAYRPHPDHVFGVALNLAYQRFEAKGVQIFAANGASAAPASFSNRGTDSATGLGLRLGYTGRLTPTLTLGATIASKTRLSKFERYQGLFAEQGDFDVPANYGVGLAWELQPALTLAADLQRIEYSGVKAVSNTLFSSAQFGSERGPGFGWRDVNVVKLGASYEVHSALTLRAGFDHVSQPVPASEPLLNILAPGVVQNHLAVGGTLRQGNGEWSVFASHAFSKTLSGAIAPNFGAGLASLHMAQNSVGLAFGWKY